MATLVHDDVLDGAPVRRGPPDRRRPLRPGPRRRGRRPALLARLRGARCRRRRARGHRAQLGLRRARARRARAAPRRLRHLDHRGALPGALLAEDRPAVRVGLPGRAPRLWSPGTEELAAFGREIGLAFQLLDDVLDVTGPPERTGKARGTDLLDGTVTLPLILARRRDPGSRPPSCEDSTSPPRRSSATGSPPPAPSIRCVAGPSRGSSAPRGSWGRPASPTRSGSCSG